MSFFFTIAVNHMEFFIYSEISLLEETLSYRGDCPCLRNIKPYLNALHMIEVLNTFEGKICLITWLDYLSVHISCLLCKHDRTTK